MLEFTQTQSDPVNAVILVLQAISSRLLIDLCYILQISKLRMSESENS